MRRFISGCSVFPWRVPAACYPLLVVESSGSAWAYGPGSGAGRTGEPSQQREEEGEERGITEREGPYDVRAREH